MLLTCRHPGFLSDGVQINTGFQHLHDGCYVSMKSMLLDVHSPADAAYPHAGGVRTLNGVRDYQCSLGASLTMISVMISAYKATQNNRTIDRSQAYATLPQ